MELLQLKYFERIAAHSSISKACQDLHVTQPALSNALKRLEEEIGVELFDRVGKRLVLNSNGQRLLRYSKQILGLVDQYIVSVQNADNPYGMISFAAQAIPSHFSQVMQDYQTFNPNVSYQIATGSNKQNLMNSHSFDFSIQSLESDVESPPACSMVIGDTQMCVLMRSNHRLAKHASLNLIDLKDYHFCLNWRQGSIEHSYQECIQAGFRPRIDYLTDQHHQKFEIIQRSDRLSFIFDCELQSIPRSLTAIPLKDCPRRTMILTWREDLGDSPVASSFLQFMKSWYASRPGLPISADSLDSEDSLDLPLPEVSPETPIPLAPGFYDPAPHTHTTRTDATFGFTESEIL